MKKEDLTIIATPMRVSWDEVPAEIGRRVEAMLTETFKVHRPQEQDGEDVNRLCQDALAEFTELCAQWMPEAGKLFSYGQFWTEAERWQVNYDVQEKLWKCIRDLAILAVAHGANMVVEEISGTERPN